MWFLHYSRKFNALKFEKLRYFESLKVLKKCYHLRSKEESLWKEGANIEGFDVTRVCKVPEFFLTGIQLKHVDTGAEYVHLARDDSNNVFSVGFRTTPFDSTGVPHILEHLCTCGSKKYPCRDPYFKMLCRSLATFMNAMTGPDYTVYPFSTQNHQDYMNLMSVYLDAVFKPMLRKTDFLQEGWRLEHQDVSDPKTPIILKGVVLNEMKGVFSDNQNLFYTGVLNNLLPSHTYGVVSGGDPLCIPSLTYENLLKFHNDYYNPSNSKFYSYGNFSLVETLSFINKEYLSLYGKIEKPNSNRTCVPLEQRWTSPKQKHIECQIDKMVNQEKQSHIAISNLCCDIQDVHKTFLLNILSELLASGPNSSFYRTLVEGNVGSGFGSMTGYFNHVRSTFFSVSLQGLNPKDFDWFIDTYNKTVDNIIKNGFDEKNIEAILHNLELTVKHQSANFGLDLLFGIVSPWIHDGDVFEFIKSESKIETFRNTIKENPFFLQEAVKTYFKDNPHRLTLTMSPREDYDKKKQKLEEVILHQKLHEMSRDQIKEVYDNGLVLKKCQDDEEDVSCLPTLKISDLNKDIEHIEVMNTKVSGIPVQICTQPTNGVTYFYGVLHAADIPEKLKNLLPVFCYVVTKMGTQNFDYKTFDQMIMSATRGLSVSYFNSDSLIHANNFNEGVKLSSECLTRNADKMFELWSDVFGIAVGSVLENQDRFKTLLTILATNYSNSIIQNGHTYAMLASAGLVSNSARRKEICGGLSMVKTLQNIVADPYEIDKTMDIIKETAVLVLEKHKFTTAINCGSDDVDKVLNHLDSFVGVSSKITENYGPSQSDTNLPIDEINKGVHFVIPGQVNYAAKSILTVPYTHEDFAPLRVLCKLLTMKYCIPVIREKGGAYGAGATLSSGGVLSFYSYRDPNSVETLNAFDRACSWVLESNFNKRDIDEAILGTFQNVDVPVPPGEKGIDNFLHGLNNEIRKKHRLELMSVTYDKIRNVAAKYLDNKHTPQGRSFIGPVNNEVTSRSGEKWTVVE